MQCSVILVLTGLKCGHFDSILKQNYVQYIWHSKLQRYIINTVTACARNTKKQRFLGPSADTEGRACSMEIYIYIFRDFYWGATFFFFLSFPSTCVEGIFEKTEWPESHYHRSRRNNLAPSVRKTSFYITVDELNEKQVWRSTGVRGSGSHAHKHTDTKTNRPCVPISILPYYIL